MPSFEEQIVSVLARKSYQPLKPKALARKLGIPSSQYSEFRDALRSLVKDKRAEFGKNHTVRPIRPHGTVTGIFRRTGSGFGFVRPHAVDGRAGPEILIREPNALDASTGDEVLVHILRKPSRPELGPVGEIVRVLER